MSYISESLDSRSLRTWLPMNIMGTDTLKAFLRETLLQTSLFKKTLEEDPRFVVLQTVNTICLVAFKIKGADNDATNKFMNTLNDTKQIFLVSSFINGEEFIRLSVGT